MNSSFYSSSFAFIIFVRFFVLYPPRRVGTRYNHRLGFFLFAPP